MLCFEYSSATAKQEVADIAQQRITASDLNEAFNHSILTSQDEDAGFLSLQCMYIKGFRVIIVSDQSVALWVKYSSFNHINYAVLKKVSAFYDYLHTTTCSENARSKYPY